MTTEELNQRLAEIRQESLPLPGKGDTARRHRRLMEVGREDLSFAKLAEAHWDALAILAEAGRLPSPGALYAVWASEIPREALRLEPIESGYSIAGTKTFCSGVNVVDRALITVGVPYSCLVEIDLHTQSETVEVDTSIWKTNAFQMTNTGSITFHGFRVPKDAVIGDQRWYLDRSGFWHGACGPAACWAGGAAGLLDFALRSKRDDPHTLAHIAAIHANVWAMEQYLEAAAQEIDSTPADREAAMMRALQVRHLVEQACTDTLRRFARTFGPYPLSMDAETSRRYQEIDVYLRQSHAERDLETLGHYLKERSIV
jgi:hypothetical protein